MFFRKFILPAILLLTPALNFTAQSETLKDLHQKAHRQQLANSKSAIDKSVIQNFIQEEILTREFEATQGKLSTFTAQIISDLIGEAKSHLGKRYRSGGKGPNVFDCSGFAGYVFKQFGFKLGASSRDQYLQGEKIEKNELRAGDLVFFTGRNRKSSVVGHVGIVVEADNENGTFKFIHASTSGGIKIDTNTGYYEGRYIGAKRVITD